MPLEWDVEKGGDGSSDGKGKSFSREKSFATTGSGGADMEALARVRSIGKYVKMRGKNDDLPQSWWFASTAIPLLAATIGPLANVLSIAALVTSWRDELANNGQLPEGKDDSGIGIKDPRWELALNAVSLVCGFVGNFFLLLNFTKRIRYIVALPLSIIFWFLATGILMGIIVAMHIYDPPVGPGETWSQGYWHAVIAAILYNIGALILMINMLGYFLGHYPQHFDLDDSQRTLILQTMMFFFWLAGGAAIFERVAGFTYSDALYFCDVTVLTIGFGDFVSPNDAGRAVVFPYSVIGIIFLGLMINSIRNFAASMSRDKVIKAHEMSERARTVGRTVTSEQELRDRLGLPPAAPRRSSDARRPSEFRRRSRANSLNRYGKFEIQGRTVTFHANKTPAQGGGRGGAGRSHKALSRDAKMQARKEGNTEHHRRNDKRQKLLLLREEKDRFEAMREIQQNTNKFKQYYALAMSVLAFGVLWCVGAVFFMLAERREQGLSYFQSLYFCYVSLLTIGYGDFSPRSNAGKAFFVVWSLLAIPTMTILISDMGDTVVSSINRGTFTLADWTVMPKKGAWREFLMSHPRFYKWLQDFNAKREEKKRLKGGFTIQNPDMDVEIQVDPDHKTSEPMNRTLESIADEGPLTEHQLARRLALAIKRTAQDLHDEPPKKYKYEDWVEFTKLIRFSAKHKAAVEAEEDEEGLIEWDWIGEDSPMLAEVCEAEWILDRLCESLNRYTRRQAHKQRPEHGAHDEPEECRRRNSHHAMRVEAVPQRRSSPRPRTPDPLEVEDENDASGSNSSAVDPKDEHFHGGDEHKHTHHHGHGHHHGHTHGHDGDQKKDGKEESPNDNLMRLHHGHESAAVRAWEERLKKSREDARLEREKDDGPIAEI